MTSLEAAGGPRAVPVLVAAAGSPWEAPALDRLQRPGGGVVLARRCVDLPDLLASASAGLASVAVVSPALPGLDGDSVAALRRFGLGVVLVAAPDELEDGDVVRLRRLGVQHVLGSAEIAVLSEAVLGAADPRFVAPEDPAALVEQVPEEGTGQVVAVWGPAGAPGRTTVAVGIATELGLVGEDVLLLDVDPYGGAVSQHLGVLDEVSGLLAAARAANAGRLDVERLASFARRVGEVRVLTGLPRPDRWQEVRPAAFDEVLSESARLASYVVADLGFSLESEPADPFGSTAPQRNEMTLATLRVADEVVVVGAADPVGLSRLARGLVELSEVLPGLRPRVVVNRTRATLGWTDREITGMVEGFVRPLEVHFLPEDRAAADRALMSGQSLSESGESALSRGLAVVAAGVARRAPPATRRRRLRIRRRGR